MPSIQFSRRNIFAIFFGFLVIILLGFITSGFVFFLAPRLARSGHMIIIFSYLIAALTLLTPIIGGFVVGWHVQKQGGLYGAILGVFLTVVSMALVSLTFILPSSLISSPDFPAAQARALAKTNLLTQLLHAPFLIFVTLLGGILGVWAYQKRQNRRTTSPQP